MPSTIASCCTDPSRPRIRAGAISAIYAGAITEAMPNADASDHPEDDQQPECVHETCAQAR